MISRWLLTTGLAAALVAPAASAEKRDPQPNPKDLGVWSDPTFQKQFLGSYGTQADVEPTVTTVEREQMQKVLPLLGSDPQAAAAELEKLAKPESSAVFDFTLGNIYFQDEQFDKAAERYRTAIAKFPSFRRAYKNLGLIDVRQGTFDEAIKSLSRVIELGGADGLTFGLLGYSYTAVERYTSAESAYRSALLLEPEVLDWKLGLTQSVLKQQKYNETASLADELIKKFPDRADFWLLQANAYIGMGEPLKAAENYEIVDRMGKSTAATLSTLGDIYVNESLFDLAARAYGKAVTKDTEQPVERPLRWIEILAQRGALSQAKSLIGGVSQAYEGRLDESGRRKLLKLGARVAVAEGKSGEAVATLEELVALDPLDGDALLLLGQNYAKDGDKDKAAFYYERAASLDAFEAEAKLRLGQLMVNQGRYAEALPLLKRSQELKPRDDIARYIEQVERASRAQR